VQWTAGRGDIALYNSCGADTYDRLAYGSPLLYRAATTGTYYIRVNATEAASKFKMSEVTITDNRICANAQMLAIGTESDALPRNNVRYWYKVNLTAGTPYLFEQSGYLRNLELFADCGSTEMVRIDMNRTYTPTESGTFYIRLYGYDNSDDVDIKVKVSEITNNRVCSKAIPIALDQNVTLPDAHIEYWSTEYWYTINLMAGKTYNIQKTGSGSVVVHNDNVCYGGGGELSNATNFVAPHSGTFYLRVSSSQAGFAFTITQTADATITDNRLCIYAQQMVLGTAVTLPATNTNTYFWYKVDLQAGKDYKFEGAVRYLLHNDCSSAHFYENYSSNLSYFYSAEASGTYYVKVYVSQNGSTLKISEVTTPTVQSVEIVANNGMSVPKGGTQKFEARVIAMGGAAQTVTWSVTGTASSIAADGSLSIGATEKARILVVTATSTADPTKKASIPVTVTTDALASAVLLVSVSPSTASVAKGSTRQFSAVVSVQGGASQAVRWSVSGGAGTSISASGLLTVAKAETASMLTVTATSTVDASKKSAATVITSVASPQLPTDVAALQAMVTRLRADSIEKQAQISILQVVLSDTIGALQAQIAALQAQLATLPDTVYQTDTVYVPQNIYVHDTITPYVNISVSGASLFPSVFNPYNDEYMVNRNLNTAAPTVISVIIGSTNYRITVPNSTPTAVINEEHSVGMLSYPNPTNGELIIDNEQLSAGDKIEIYNVNGVLVGAYGIRPTINIGHLPAGVYIVKIGNKTAKVVKQ
jgi:hypothetical protein